jgi:adenylate cyclase
MSQTLTALQRQPGSNSKGGRKALLLDICMQPAFWGEPEELKYLTELQQLAEKKGHTPELAQITYFLGKYYLRKGDYLQASRQLNNAEQLFGSNQNQAGVIDCQVAQAEIEKQLANYEKALAESENIIAESRHYEKGMIAGLNLKSHLLDFQGKLNEAMGIARTAFELAEKTDDFEGKASACRNIARIYDWQGKYADAMQYYRQALTIYEEMGDRFNAASVLVHIADVNWQQGNHTIALKQNFETLKLLEKIGDKADIVRTTNCIGNIYSNLRKYDEALKFYDRAYKLGNELQDKRAIVSLHYNIGIIHHEKGDEKEALKYHLRALELCQEIGHKHYLAACLNYVGNIYSTMGDYHHALDYQLQGLEVAGQIAETRRVAHSLVSAGKTYYKLGQEAESVSHLQQGLNLATDLGEKSQIRDALVTLTEIYSNRKDFEKALGYHKRYHQVENEIAGEEAQIHIAQLSFQNNLEQKEKEAEINRLKNVELHDALMHLQIEKDRSESLLLNILPAEVAAELKEKGESEAKQFDNVTVMFSDFQNFTGFAEKLSPKELVSELNTCFKAFDQIISKFKLEKIKTVGDGYIAVAGLPVANPKHAEEMLRAAIAIRDFMAERRANLGDNTFEVRIGLHTGKVVAGIVGLNKYAYDIWGDAVNTAARMQQHSKPGHINISGETYELVKDKFNCSYRGKIAAKHKGEVDMYFVE